MVALTDSDTLWEKDTLENLVKVIVGHDKYREENTTCSCIKIKECGAVTGDVRIWNK